ncbi:pyridoxal phosphate (PLP)-dependent transferasessuperfamily protein [Striga asiatica]|uniref:Pyridoxal phosphate (PLP)-dependent transferasessuperfamily protein n=1 Tax=Striga asiatica TaxID=4170 RepID=A0A5A7QDC7_STRAF|nr:pyridoxal phosphate (PLP)-dependent transferasessuperfamily protein [Striga asiatica]
MSEYHQITDTMTVKIIVIMQEAWSYHEGKTRDGGPRVGEVGAGELEVSEVAGEHDRDERDEVVRNVGQYHRQREQHLPLGLLHVDGPAPPPRLGRRRLRQRLP